MWLKSEANRFPQAQAGVHNPGTGKQLVTGWRFVSALVCSENQELPALKNICMRCCTPATQSKIIDHDPQHDGAACIDTTYRPRMMLLHSLLDDVWLDLQHRKFGPVEAKCKGSLNWSCQVSHVNIRDYILLTLDKDLEGQAHRGGWSSIATQHRRR